MVCLSSCAASIPSALEAHFVHYKLCLLVKVNKCIYICAKRGTTLNLLKNIIMCKMSLQCKAEHRQSLYVLTKSMKKTNHSLVGKLCTIIFFHRECMENYE